MTGWPAKSLLVGARVQVPFIAVWWSRAKAEHAKSAVSRTAPAIAMADYFLMNSRQGRTQSGRSSSRTPGRSLHAPCRSGERFRRAGSAGAALRKAKIALVVAKSARGFRGGGRPPVSQTKLTKDVDRRRHTSRYVGQSGHERASSVAGHESST